MAQIRSVWVWSKYDWLDSLCKSTTAAIVATENYVLHDLSHKQTCVANGWTLPEPVEPRQIGGRRCKRPLLRIESWNRLFLLACVIHRFSTPQIPTSRTGLWDQRTMLIGDSWANESQLFRAALARGFKRSLNTSYIMRKPGAGRLISLEDMEIGLSVAGGRRVVDFRSWEQLLWRLHYHWRIDTTTTSLLLE